jgi:hypothetical protein
MKASKALATMLVICCSTFVWAQQSMLDEWVKDIPVGETVSITSAVTRASMDVQSVAAASDMVVDGRVTRTTAVASVAPAKVSTNIVIAVNSVWADRTSDPSKPRPAIQTLTVQQPGGRLEYQGRIIEVRDPSFPIFRAGTELILFLSKGEDDAMTIVGGPYGAFVKESGRLKSLLPSGHELHSRYDGLELSTFRSLVTEAMAGAR